MKYVSNYSCRVVFSILLGCSHTLSALGRGPKDRGHTEIESKPVTYYPTTEDAPTGSKVTITVTDKERVIKANGMPNHKMGKYPNAGNPNTPTVQNFEVLLPLKPEINEKPIRANRSVGVMVNGVLIEAGSGEFWFSKNGSSTKPVRPVGSKDHKKEELRSKNFLGYFLKRH